MGRHAAKGLRRFRRPTGFRRTAGAATTSTVADVQLLLHSRRLAAICGLAVLLPFGVYFAVMVLTGELAHWAPFLFAPMIVAGVSVGAVLDRAYGRAEKAAEPAA